MLDVIKGMALGAVAVLFARTLRRRSDAAAVTDDGVPPARTDPISIMMERIGENAPAIVAQFTGMQMARAQREAQQERTEARASALSWRKLAVEHCAAGWHDSAEVCARHALEIEREFDLAPEKEEAEEEKEDAPPRQHEQAQAAQ